MCVCMFNPFFLFFLYMHRLVPFSCVAIIYIVVVFACLYLYTHIYIEQKDHTRTHTRKRVNCSTVTVYDPSMDTTGVLHCIL